MKQTLKLKEQCLDAVGKVLEKVLPADSSGADRHLPGSIWNFHVSHSTTA